MQVNRREVRRLGAWITSTALLSIAILLYRADSLAGYTVELLLLFTVGVFAGASLGELVYQKWISPTQERPGSPEPSTFYVWTVKSIGVSGILYFLVWLVVSLARSQLPDLRDFAYMTLLISPGITMIGFQSRSLVFLMINLLMLLFDLAVFVLSPDWAVLSAIWICLGMTAGSFLARRAACSKESEGHFNGPLAPQG